MSALGKIIKIDDLRTIWKHEARDFSKWLAQEDNLALLGETIGIDIILKETESSVGSFSVDLFATEAGTGRKIIIENQLEDTNHDHLGKIITYASGKGAEIIIWIVKRARDEHIQAIEWLNQHTDENIGFFLIEIELWKINDSVPAPKFSIIEKPNDWAKAMKVVDGLSDLRKLLLDFWQSFANYAYKREDFSKNFTVRKAQPQSWFGVSVGSSSYHINFSVNSQKKTICTEIYFRDDKQTFEQFRSHAKEIEAELGTEVICKEASKDCRIYISRDGDIKKSSDQWQSYFDWFCDMGIKMKAITSKYGN